MNRVKFDVKISDIEQVNPLFSKCKVYICYSDLNRNNSIISKELINDKLYTLYNCPIVGQFSKEKDDFTDHGGAVELDKDGDWQYIVTTIPYGIVPESSEVKWEYINGKDYLTCTGYLWTSRYPEALKVIDEGRPQSMEIEEVQGNWNGKKQFMISDFVFSALTILGNDVEPCFEDAKIVAYTLDKDDFKREFNLMIQELKTAIDNKCLDQTSNGQAFVNSNKKEDEVVIKTKKEIAAQFSLTVNQLYEEMSRALDQCKYMTTNWYGEEVEVSRFYLRDFDEQFAYGVDRQNDYIDVKISYSMSGDNVVFDLDTVKRIKYVPTDWEGEMPSDGMMDDDEMMSNFSLALVNEVKEVVTKFTSEKDELNSKLSEKEDVILSLTEQFSQVKTESEEKDKKIESLQEFKKQIEEGQRKEMVDAIFAKFAKHLTKEEIESFREKEQTFSKFEDFEKEIKSYVCDKVVEDVKREPATFSRMGIPPQGNQDDQDNTESSDVWDRLSNKNK